MSSIVDPCNKLGLLRFGFFDFVCTYLLYFRAAF